MAKLFVAEAAKAVITGRRQQAIDDALREIGPDAAADQQKCQAPIGRA